MAKPSRGFLFPSLKHLKVKNTNSYFAYLHIFLGPSLEALDFHSLHDTNEDHLLSFLKAAATYKPQLKIRHLALDVISPPVLETFLSMKSLRHLELSISPSTFDFTFFEAIGTSLNLLEEFIFRPKNGFTYSPPLSPRRRDELRRKKEVWQQDDEDIRRLESRITQLLDQQRESERQIEEQHINALRYLDELNLSGNRICLDGGKKPRHSVRDLLEMKRNERKTSAEPDQEISNEIVNIRLTLGPLLSKQANRPKDDDDLDTIEILDQGGRPTTKSIDQANGAPPDFCPERNLFNHLRVLEIRASAALIQDFLNTVSAPTLQNLSLTIGSFCDKPKNTTSNGRCNPCVSILNVLDEGSFNLKTLSLASECYQNTSISKPLLLKWILNPEMEQLNISGFVVEDLDTSLEEGLKTLATRSKLRCVHFPSSQITLLKLQEVAELCPDLISLHCKFADLSFVPRLSPGEEMPKQDLFCHKLRFLSVSNNTGGTNPNELLNIARFLYSMFPDLKTIEAPGTSSDWKLIGNMVQTFHSIRADDISRGRLVPQAKDSD